MSRKKNKGKRGFNNDEVWVLGFGGFLLALGILSIAIAIFRANEIAKSEVAKEFEAVVTYSELKQHDLSASQRREVEKAKEYGQSYYIAPDYYYKSTVEIEVDGKKYKGNYYSEGATKVGDKVKVYAYQTAGGKYKIADPIKLNFGSYIVTGALAVLIGGGLCLMCVISRAMDNAGKKNKKKKNNNKNNNNNNMNNNKPSTEEKI
ncbi:hypothetical protein SAMN06297422_11578 [Lachnospiraceae bacterium]|nr:hypothetical protein SAMN06297422_11578 [Lachnospiraceae bacterium]